MEENIEYTAPETEAVNEYIEESTPENPEENLSGNTEQTPEGNTAPGPEETGEPETGTAAPDSEYTGNSNLFDGTDTDSTSADTNTTGTDNTGTDASDISGSRGSTETDTEDTENGTSLLDRVENLLDALAPENAETDGFLSDSPEPELSEYDTQTLETLQNIETLLSGMQAQNELWHTETLKYREETREANQDLLARLEVNALLLAGAGFFLALLCGGKFADIFFRRMKGDGGHVR